MKRFLSGFITAIVILGISFQTAAALDHSTFDRLLDQYVSGGYFDYESFVDDPDAVKSLKKYQYRMSKVDLDKLERSEVLAYWINLYNASTLHLAVKNYPLESIKDIGGWFSSPFDKTFIPTRRGKISLNTIEHEIIRPEFAEPRIHFALVCAARSCPPLRYEAYTGKSLDEQLEDQTQRFINSDKNRFLIRNDQLRMQLSSIFYWYGEDFGGEKELAKYLKSYLSDRKKKLVESGDYTIEYLDYDWSLNQTPGPYNR